MIDIKSVGKAAITLGGAMVGAIAGEAITDKVVQDGMYKKFLEYQNSEEYKKLSDEEKIKKVNRYNTKATLTHAYICGLSQIVAGSATSAINSRIDNTSSNSSFTTCCYTGTNVSSLNIGAGQSFDCIM